MDNKESYCSVESDGTANGTVVRDQAGNVLKRVSEINIRAKVGEPFVTAQIEVLCSSIKLDTCLLIYW